MISFGSAKAIAEHSSAELYLPSKAERGYQLARGQEGPVSRATPVKLRKSMTVPETFQIIAHSAISHFSANAVAVRNLDPEGIHQMRVGLRRLRAAISLFSKALSATRVQEIKAELKWLTNALAPAREFDVFVKERIQPIIPRIVPRRGGRAVIKDFSIKRAEAFDHAKKAVASERFRLLLVTLLEWVENRRTYSRFPKVSIEHFAIDILHRRIMKVSKDGRRLRTAARSGAAQNPHSRSKRLDMG